MDICVFGAEKKGDKIVIYGRDRNGKKTVKEVDFNDYYYASPTSNKSRAYLKKHGKPVRKTLLGKEVEVYKVSSKIEVDDAERYCKEIPAPRKFILDNKIEPMHKNGKPMELKILAVDIEMYTPDMNLTSNKNPIIMVGLASENLRKVITWKNVNLEYVEVVKSEKEMLERFSEIVKEVDPDVIVGYNSDSFDFTHIKERARILKAKVDFSWDGRGIITKHKGAFVLGPVHVDLYQFIRNILSSNLKTDVYTLNAVCNELIGVGKKDMSAERMIEIWGSDENIDRIAEYNINDAEITYKLAKKILPIMMELVKLTSLPLFNVSRATYSTLVEELIIKEVWDKEVIPRKVFGSVVEDRYEKTYEGAFVYEPAPGVYENVAVFDFRSLYPSIIVTHNICPSTIGCKKNCYESPIGTKFRKRPEGFIPCILKRLIEERAEIKDRIKKEKDTTLESKQYALKILANSFYGYLGYPKSRWYSIECAKSITAWGRKYIQETLELISENGYKVLYADTDSAMFIHKGKKKAIELLNNINRRMPGIIKMGLQGFYSRVIFVKKKAGEKGAKKKYAMISESGEITIKGFEYVRRDWSEIAKKTQQRVIEAILKDNNPEKALEIIREVVKKLKKREISIRDVAIKSQIRKNLAEYQQIGPHVRAAMRKKRVIPGTIISYVVMSGRGRISDRVKLLEEVKEGDKYDADYYIERQVVPAVRAIMETVGYTKNELLGFKQEGLAKWMKK